jgi:hypothetical protein
MDEMMYIRCGSLQMSFALLADLMLHLKPSFQSPGFIIRSHSHNHRHHKHGRRLHSQIILIT